MSRGSPSSLALLLLCFAPAHAQVLSDFPLNHISVEGGNTVTGTVTLDAPAPSGGVTIDLYSDNPSAATLSQQVFRLLFVSPVGSTEVQMALSFRQGSVSGGAPVTGNVYLGRVAPVGGTTVSLYSSDIGLATVPASVTVPEGAATVSFPVQTVAVPSNIYNAFNASCEAATFYGFLWFDAVLPNAPSDFTATPRSYAVKLSWDAAQGVARYNVKSSSTSGPLCVRGNDCCNPSRPRPDNNGRLTIWA